MSAQLVAQDDAPIQAIAQFTPGFGSSGAFELIQRQARLFSSSTLVPKSYRAWNEVRNKDPEPNPNALANCVVALNIATRMNADPLMVMQNLNIIEGRPSWASTYIIAAINSCGRFGPLRFEISPKGPITTVSYTVKEWNNNVSSNVKKTAEVPEWSCRAWAVDRATGATLYGPTVDMAMAVAEGWYTKAGSKWQTMPELMLMYRAAAFFGRLYAPELLMGLPAADEIVDITPAGGTFDPDPQPQPKTTNYATPRAKTAAPTAPAANAPTGQPDFDPETGEIYSVVATVNKASEAPTEGKQEGSAEVSPEVQPEAQTPTKADAGTAPKATPGVVAMVKKKMAEFGIDGEAMTFETGIADIDAMTVAQGSAALDFFRRKAAKSA